MRAAAFVGMGANRSAPRRNLARALRRLRGLPDARVAAVSRLYVGDAIETLSPQAPYWNAAVKIQTALPPRVLLARLHGIERAMGRARRGRKRPRPIDLDILAYGAARARRARLHLPHRRLAWRKFALAPLAEIAGGDFAPPGLAPVSRLLARVADQNARPVAASGRWRAF